MAKKSRSTTRTNTSSLYDISKWNFVIFLTLAFILMVIVAITMSNVSRDVSARAGLSCPRVQTPDPQSCPGGWKFTTINGCATFVCEAQ